MSPSSRVQVNIVNQVERRFLDWACARMPAAITSDHLTAFGVFGAVLVLCGYVGTRVDCHFLWLSALGYVIHWFGDSLDGSLARFRNVARPRYGYFLDHSLDALCIMLMIGGLGLSSYVSLDVALFVVVAYFAMSIHVFLKNAATGTFQLSFMAMGPTEFRMVFIAITVWMFVQGTGGAHVIGFGLSSYDAALLAVGAILVVLFLVNTTGMILQLRALEGDGRAPLPSAALDQSRQVLMRPRIKDMAANETLRPATARRGL